MGKAQEKKAQTGERVQREATVASGILLVMAEPGNGDLKQEL
jgi:hypothetical protein